MLSIVNQTNTHHFGSQVCFTLSQRVSELWSTYRTGNYHLPIITDTRMVVDVSKVWIIVNSSEYKPLRKSSVFHSLSKSVWTLIDILTLEIIIFLLKAPEWLKFGFQISYPMLTTRNTHLFGSPVCFTPSQRASELWFTYPQMEIIIFRLSKTPEWL